MHRTTKHAVFWVTRHSLRLNEITLKSKKLSRFKNFRHSCCSHWPFSNFIKCLLEWSHKSSLKLLLNLQHLLAKMQDFWYHDPYFSNKWTPDILFFSNLEKQRFWNGILRKSRSTQSISCASCDWKREMSGDPLTWHTYMNAPKKCPNNIFQVCLLPEFVAKNSGQISLNRIQLFGSCSVQHLTVYSEEMQSKLCWY